MTVAALVLVPLGSILLFRGVVCWVFCGVVRLGFGTMFCTVSRSRLSGIGGRSLLEPDPVLRPAVRKVGVADRPDRLGRLLVLPALLPSAVGRVAVPVLP